MPLLRFLSDVYEGERQQDAAEDAARRQAEGVANAQRITQESRDAARNALLGISGDTMGPSLPSGVRQPIGLPTQGLNPLLPQPLMQQFSQAGFGDPFQNLMSGLQAGVGFTSGGFGEAIGTLNPLAAMAQPYLQEQQALLGLGGQDAQQAALSRISDPLVAEQERALLRNNAALGGVGGNVLSALAEQTRQRTQANIGDRLQQLASASTPGLNALQGLADLRLNRGLAMSELFTGAGSDLATREENLRRSLANVELGQGSELAQLAQNMGIARAGGSAFRAANPSGLSRGVSNFSQTGLDILGGLI